MKALLPALIAFVLGAAAGAGGLWWLGDRRVHETAQLQQDLAQSREQIGSLEQRLAEAARSAAAAQERGDRLQAVIDQQTEALAQNAQTQRQRLQQEVERAKARAAELERELAALDSGSRGQAAGVRSGEGTSSEAGATSGPAAAPAASTNP